MKNIFFASALVFAAFLSSCSMNTMSTGTHTVNGPNVAVGLGSAHSYATLDDNQNLVTLGLYLNEAAMSTLPDSGTMIDVALPSDVLNSSQFKSIELDYATTDPAPYNKPHLDCHFYMMSMDQRMLITAGKDTAMHMMDTSMMPPGMMPDGSCEEMMGDHWMDTSGVEYHGGKFQSTFDYGFHRGQMVFMETMADKSSLITKNLFTGPTRRPSHFMMQGFYPSTYRVGYDATVGMYFFEIRGFGGMMMH